MVSCILIISRGRSSWVLNIYNIIPSYCFEWISIYSICSRYFCTNNIYENYIIKYLDELSYDLQYFNFNDVEKKPNNLWVIYYRDTTKIKFKIPEKFSGYNITDEKYLNNLNLFLLTK